MPQGGKRQGAGRPYGATGLKRKVSEICKKFDLDPTEEIIKIVKDQSTPLEVRSRLLQDLQSYTAPRLKAIELTGSLDDDRPIEIISFKGVKPEDLPSDT